MAQPAKPLGSSEQRAATDNRSVAIALGESITSNADSRGARGAADIDTVETTGPLELMAQASGSGTTVNGRQKVGIITLLLLDCPLSLPVVHHLAKVGTNPWRCVLALLGIAGQLQRVVGRHEQHALRWTHLQRFPSRDIEQGLVEIARLLDENIRNGKGKRCASYKRDRRGHPC